MVIPSTLNYSTPPNLYNSP